MNINAKPKSLRKIIFFFIGFVLSFLMYELLVFRVYNKEKPRQVISSVTQRLDRLVKKTYELENNLEGLIADTIAPNDWKLLDGYFKEIPQVVVIKKAGRLLYWNHDNGPDFTLRAALNRKPEVRLLPSGWYLVYGRHVKGYSVGIYSKLQNNYSIQNVYLSNRNTPLFSLPSNVQFSLKGDFLIKKYKVSIKLKNLDISCYSDYTLSFIFFVSYLFLLLLLYYVYDLMKGKIVPKYNRLLDFAFIVDLLILRVLDWAFAFPHFIKQTPLFCISVSGVPGFSSIGDLILDLLILLFILLALKSIFINVKLSGKFRFWLTIFFGGLLFFFPYLAYSLTDSILLNVGLSAYPNSFIFNSGIFQKLVIILVLNFIIYYWVYLIVKLLKDNKWNSSLFLVILVAEVIAITLVFELELVLVCLVFFTIILLFLVIWFISYQRSPYLFSIVVLIIISASGAFLFNITKTEIKNAHQHLTAELLAQQNDPYLEFRLRELAPQILEDSVLQNYILRDDNGDSISAYLIGHYLTAYFSSYSMQVTLCEPFQKLDIQEDNTIITCDAYFSMMDVKSIANSARFSLSLLNNLQQSLYYIAKFRFPLGRLTNDSLNLYVEFYRDFIPKGLGYPELLVDARQTKLQLAGYSFARYSQGELQFKFGDFLYPVDESYFAKHQPKQFFTKDGYLHLIHKGENNDLIIISRAKANLSQKVLPFSLLFMVSGILILVFVIILNNKSLRKVFQYSLSTRLQLIFFSAVVIIFMLLSIVTLYYFNDANHSRIEVELKEKAHSVLIELQHKFATVENMQSLDSFQIENYLQKFSLVFFSDINLYDLSGKLIASSRPEIFDRALQSRWINPDAYFRILIKHQLFYLSREKIGALTFYSSYMPLILDDGKTVGIINLPFFARNNEIQQSYYQMMANLVNLFVITGILGLILMMFLSKILTKPLRILQEKIKGVSIERKNEMIEWKEDDEIGQLIDSYNQMVSKLEQSAEVLKSSEREKAWREMARQIAHEIRNPLTPMKLNVQYLQKAYQQKDEKFGERLRNISESLISQIETLNEVAGMFSDFSKTGVQKDQKANLVETLMSSIALFKKSYDVAFVLHLSEKEEAWVHASSHDLLRIFTNLIKNAIQSMEGSKDIRVEIKLYEKASAWIIEIQDFGKGIPREDQKRIFQPYFTTKSTGTGIGLAIVKNMMNELGGTVEFESEAGKGSRFILSFPVFHV